MANQTNQSTTKQQLTTLLEGILLGRTFHDLEKQAGVSAETLLKRLALDEQLFLDFKQAREFSAYVMADEALTLARANMEAPESAVKNNALKIYLEQTRWDAERRNPGVFSGKAAVNVTVPIQIHTDIDLNSKKSVEGVYELEAIHIEERAIEELQDGSAAVKAEFAPAPEPDNPFSRALLVDAAREVAQEVAGEFSQPQETGPSASRRHPGLDKPQLSRRKGKKQVHAAPIPGKKPRVPRHRARKEPLKNEAHP